MGDHVAPSTTQQAYPGRATARTLVQNILGWVIGAGIVIPASIAIAQEELARFLPEQVLAVLATTAGVSAAVSTVAARVMAIPRVDRWLSGAHLSSSPRV